MPPQVSPHPVDVMTKTINTMSSTTPSTAPPLIFPPLPPGLTQPSTSSNPTPAQPITFGVFPRPPPSLRVDPYELTLPKTEPEIPEPVTDEEVEDAARGRNQ